MEKAVRRFLIEDGLGERLSWDARRKVEVCDWTTILPRCEKLFIDIIGGSGTS